MLTCAEIIQFLMDYLDGNLPSEQLTAFDKHMAVCPACQAFLQNYRQVIALAKSSLPSAPVAAHDELPPELVQAILAARQQ
jgi:anti-sigma factor RsiW